MSALSDAFGPDSIRVGVKVADWRQALLVAGELLTASGRTKAAYGQAMVDTVDELGPYIVIAPGIALGHAKAQHASGASLVFETGMSLAILSDPVEFGNAANDPVRLVFGLAALDHDGHIELMAAFAEKLSDPAIVNCLLNAGSSEEILTLFS